RPAESTPPVADLPTGGLAAASPSNLPNRIDLLADEIFYRLAFANERDLVAAHHRFRRQRARIVIGGHDESIRPCAHDREQIARAQLWHFPILGKKITAFTNRSNDIDLVCFTLTGRFAASSPRGRGLR